MMTEIDVSDKVRFVGSPDGPRKRVPELGCEVGTFTTEPGDRKVPALKWHVPLRMRGDFRPEELANYDPEKAYRTDDIGKVLCYGYTYAGERCKKRAVNRYPKCEFHGGRLHPLDKIVREDDSGGEGETLSRYQAFKKGEITVDDLDDEELAMCGFRAKNGRIYRPRNVPRELANAFTKAIYERAQQELRSHTVKAAQTMAEIMMNKTIEPDIRLKAASSLLDRNLGKAPQVVAITNQLPWEEVFDEIRGGSREFSRERRAITSERPGTDERIIDVETIEQSSPVETDGNIVDESSNGLKSSGRQQDSRNPTAAYNASQESSMGLGGERREPEVVEIEPEPLNDSRMFERNEAILAQTIELKPFEYDLSDRRKEIKQATKRRYVSRALGVDLTGDDVPFVRIEKLTDTGKLRVRHVHPDEVKTDTQKINADTQRRRFSLSDFERG